MIQLKSIKTITILTGVFLVAGLILFGIGIKAAVGAEPFKIACSAQAYDILKGKPLEIIKQKTGLNIELEVTNSAEAMNRVFYDVCEMAVSAERADYRLTSQGFKEYPFCKDALIVVANIQTKLKDITHDQVRKVFTKQITNAKDLGGADKPLVVVSPGESTALYKNFKQMFMGEDKISYDVMTTQSTYVNSFARRIEGAITFVNQSATESEKGRPLGASLVKIDGLGPDDDQYPYQETFYLMFKSEPGGDIKKIMDAFYSDEFCNAIRSKCLEPVEKGGTS
jgi:phosphate transport system substrate-binding protein